MVNLHLYGLVLHHTAGCKISGKHSIKNDTLKHNPFFILIEVLHSRQHISQQIWSFLT